jgi:hypothetical protein
VEEVAMWEPHTDHYVLGVVGELVLLVKMGILLLIDLEKGEMVFIRLAGVEISLNLQHCLDQHTLVLLYLNQIANTTSLAVEGAVEILQVKQTL